MILAAKLLHTIPEGITAAVMLASPWPLLATGLVLGIRPERHRRLIRRATLLALGAALLGALVSAVTYGLGFRASPVFWRNALPAGLGSFAIAVDLNAVTVLLFLLVTFVGIVVCRFSQSYMAGDAREGRFYRWFALTMGLFLTLIVTNNLWAFLLSWIATSLFLHELLAFYRERPAAVLAAWKKFLFARLADASLAAGFVIVVGALGTSRFSEISARIAHLPNPLPASLALAAGLFAFAALLKSAQFPFHGWLIEVMEAPTPVSALLHAGIIYTGAILLLRVSAILVRVPGAEALLVVAGTLSLAIVSLAMMIETNIKESLAYSTCAQMGFMLMECGFGLYVIAVLHMTGHSLYKAHAFLSSGSGVDQARAPSVPVRVPPRSPGTELGVLAVAFLATLASGALFGVSVLGDPALFLVGTILTVALTNLVLLARPLAGARPARASAWVLGLGLGLAVTYFALHALFSAVLGSSLPAIPRADALEDGLVAATGLVFLVLLFLQQRIPALGRSRLGRALYVHFSHALYADLALERVLRRLLPVPHRTSTQRAWWAALEQATNPKGSS